MRVKTIVAAVVAVALLVAGYFGAEPAMIGLTQQQAAQRGIELHIARLSFDSGGIWLHGVTAVFSRGSLRNSQVRVAIQWFRVARIAVHGGEAELRWRAPKPSTPGHASERVPVDLVGLNAKLLTTRNAFVWGVSGADVLAKREFAFDLARLDDGPRVVEVRQGSAQLRGTKLRRFNARELRVALRQALPRRGGPPKADRVSLLTRLEARLAETLDLEADIKVDECWVQLTQGNRSVRLGPSQLAFHVGPLAVKAELRGVRANRGSATFVLSRTERTSTLLVTLPRVALSDVGVKSGDFGILEPEKARIEGSFRLAYAERSKTLDFDARGALEQLSLFAPKLSTSKIDVSRLTAMFAGSVALDSERLSLTNVEIELGGAKTRGQVDLTNFTSPALDLRVQVPLQGCDTLLDAVPPALTSRVSGAKLGGTFDLDARLHYEASNTRANSIKWRLKNECRVARGGPLLSLDRLKHSFEYDVRNARGELVKRESGPDSANWVARESISRFMTTAVLICEDGRFFRHKGFDEEAIRNSILANLAARRFVRGASTITMQLAKNLFLAREKTVARKLQEAVIALQLEQSLTKEEILELYLNVVEFGPDVYGVRDASAHYFATTPEKLSLGQALYLASLLPNPKHDHFERSGVLSRKWRRYIDILERKALRLKLITEQEREEYESELIAFRTPYRRPTEAETARAAQPAPSTAASPSASP